MSTSSTASATPPVYRLTPSAWLRGALIALFLLAVLVALIAPGLAPTLRIAALILTLAVAAWTAPQHWPTQPRAVQAFQLESGHYVRIRRYDGAQARYHLRDSRIWPALVVLALAEGRDRRVLFIPRDALEGEAHRQLRRAVSAC